MIPAALVALAIAGAPPTVADATDATDASEPVPRTREELRADYRDLMRQTAAGRRPDPAEVVPALVELCRDLDSAEGVSSQERERLQGGVESRLLQLRGRLIRDAKARGTGARADGAFGGGANGPAQQLISLITTTIEPDSWAVNGGKGTIGYYAVPQPVLVIRQTGEVHHQVGAVLGNLPR